MVLGLGSVAAVIITIGVLFRKKKQPPPMQSFSNKAREKIVEAETDAKIAHLKADAEKKAEQAKLDEIGKIEDGRERRRRLADYLDENL